VQFKCPQATIPDSRAVLDWRRTVRLRRCVRSRLWTQTRRPAVRTKLGRALTLPASPPTCHYTSYHDFQHRLISISSLVTYSHRHFSRFLFHFKTRRRSAELPCASCNRRSASCRTFLSGFGILFYSARLIRNSLSGS
jgi:hypothetical protein